MCGLEIVDAAAELNEREPDRPLGLGVGVHAGDAVETAEGYIGSAVNLAARLCAVAQPGEVLVTSTVKGITEASLPVGFIARGRQRLKGFREPVETYAVTRDTTARAAVVLPRVGMLLGVSGSIAVAFAVILALLAIFPANPITPGPQPVVMGPLAIGAYAPQQFEPAFTFEVADAGWAASRDQPGIFGLVREAPPSGSVFFGRVQEVIANPCVEGGEGATGPSAPDVIAELEALDHVELPSVQPIGIGGATGQQADVVVAEGALAACGGLIGAEVAVFDLGDEIWRASPGERFRVVAVTVEDQPVTIILSLDWLESRSVQELESLFALGQRVLETVQFSGSPQS
jgi:hypothetical protein